MRVGYWHALKDSGIQCDLMRAYKLKDSQRGMCFVRRREAGSMAPNKLRSLQLIRYRPDQKESAQPLLSRLAQPLCRHCWLQSRLQVLPELVHLHFPQDGHSCGLRPPRKRLRTPQSATVSAASPTPTMIPSSSSSILRTSRVLAGTMGLPMSQSPPATSSLPPRTHFSAAWASQT